MGTYGTVRITSDDKLTSYLLHRSHDGFGDNLFRQFLTLPAKVLHYQKMQAEAMSDFETFDSNLFFSFFQYESRSRFSFEDYKAFHRAWEMHLPLEFNVNLYLSLFLWARPLAWSVTEEAVWGESGHVISVSGDRISMERLTLHLDETLHDCWEEQYQQICDRYYQGLIHYPPVVEQKDDKLIVNLSTSGMLCELFWRDLK